MLHGPPTGMGSGGASAAAAHQGGSLHDQELLWMHSAPLGELHEMMNGQYQLWPELAKDLLIFCEGKVDPGAILDCGKLTIPVDLSPSPKDFQPGDGPGKNIGVTLRSRIAAFLIAFMRANGQLGYIQSQEWFTSGLYSVVIEINFYPERGFSEADEELGVHKDTDSRNLFVNLIFNNETDIPGTEWTMDEALPDQKRLQELLHFLPEKEVTDIIKAKKMMAASKGGRGRDYWEGGVAAGPHTYTSWVDELYWHATPAMLPRPAFKGDVILHWLAKGAGAKESDRLAFYEAMLIVLRRGKLIHSREWLQTVLRDLATWEAAAADLRNGKTEGGISWYEEIVHVTQAIDWSSQKRTGGAGFVEVRDPKGDLVPEGRGIPTSAGGRPRANSDPKVQDANFAAIAAMKKAQAAIKKPVHQQSAAAPQPVASAAAANSSATQVLPNRTFIRTWVTIVKK